MLKWLLMLNLLFVTAASAEDEVDLLAPEPTETLDDKAEASFAISLPSCNDSDLLNKVSITINEYDDKTPVRSLFERRQRLLKHRSLTDYAEERVAGFTSEKNRAVAAKLLMTKINFGLDDSQIRLCKSQSENSSFKPVYLIIYPSQRSNDINVNIMEYQEESVEELKFTM